MLIVLTVLTCSFKVRPNLDGNGMQHNMALDEEFAAQLEEQERLAANARLPPPSQSSCTLPQHSSTLHSSRTSLASSHYD
ncbi:hypothetical protein RR48_02365 [Papilio machaon]|uniref:Uncharacterized protein n=1 Tax=Papilio machaon TaxID=76193 RepID=A0A0N0PDB2_PAPMA|nr:hypothetical protein RR48_02365 [Papilio machaon]